MNFVTFVVNFLSHPSAPSNSNHNGRQHWHVDHQHDRVADAVDRPKSIPASICGRHGARHLQLADGDCVVAAGGDVPLPRETHHLVDQGQRWHSTGQDREPRVSQQADQTFHQNDHQGNASLWKCRRFYNFAIFSENPNRSTRSCWRSWPPTTPWTQRLDC